MYTYKIYTKDQDTGTLLPGVSIETDFTRYTSNSSGVIEFSTNSESIIVQIRDTASYYDGANITITGKEGTVATGTFLVSQYAIKPTVTILPQGTYGTFTYQLTAGGWTTPSLLAIATSCNENCTLVIHAEAYDTPLGPDLTTTKTALEWIQNRNVTYTCSSIEIETVTIIIENPCANMVIKYTSNDGKYSDTRTVSGTSQLTTSIKTSGAGSITINGGGITTTFTYTGTQTSFTDTAVHQQVPATTTYTASGYLIGSSSHQYKENIIVNYAAGSVLTDNEGFFSIAGISGQLTVNFIDEIGINYFTFVNGIQSYSINYREKDNSTGDTGDTGDTEDTGESAEEGTGGTQDSGIITGNGETSTGAIPVCGGVLYASTEAYNSSTGGFSRNVDIDISNNKYYLRKYFYEILCGKVYIAKRERIGYDFFTKNRNLTCNTDELIEAVQLHVLGRPLTSDDSMMMWNLYRVDTNGALGVGSAGKWTKPIYIKRNTPVNKAGVPTPEYARFKQIYTANLNSIMTEVIPIYPKYKAEIYHKGQTLAFALAGLDIEFSSVYTQPFSTASSSSQYLKILDSMKIDMNKVTTYVNEWEDTCDTLPDISVLKNETVYMHNNLQDTHLNKASMDYIKSRVSLPQFDTNLALVLAEHYNQYKTSKFETGLADIKAGNYSATAYITAKYLLNIDRNKLLMGNMVPTFKFPDTVNDGAPKTFHCKKPALANIESFILKNDSGWQDIAKLQYYMFNGVIPVTGYNYLRAIKMYDYRICKFLETNFFNMDFANVYTVTYDFYREKNTGMFIKNNKMPLTTKIRTAYNDLTSDIKKLSNTIVINYQTYEELGEFTCREVLEETATLLQKNTGFPFVMEADINSTRRAIDLCKGVLLKYVS